MINNKQTITKAQKLVSDFIKEVDSLIKANKHLDTKVKRTQYSNKEVVTELDLQIQKAFVNKVANQMKGHETIGEEDNKSANNFLWQWYIDPIDGTTLFARNIEEWGIIISLAFHNKPIMAWVYLPYSNNLYSTVLGEGSFKNGKKISVSKTKKFDNIIVSSVYLDTMDRQFHMLSKLWNKSLWSIVGRSLAKDFSELSEGKIDVSICFNCATWEYKALSLLVKEAGGICLDFEGNLFDNQKTHPQNFIAVSNKKLAKEIIRLISTPSSVNN